MQPFTHAEVARVVDRGLGAQRPTVLVIACTAAGSATSANALSNGVKPMPALAVCRLAYSLPLMHTFALYGKYEQNLTKNGPRSSSTA
jgi:hypothetical protein